MTGNLVIVEIKAIDGNDPQTDLEKIAVFPSCPPGVPLAASDSSDWTDGAAVRGLLLGADSVG